MNNLINFIIKTFVIAMFALLIVKNIIVTHSLKIEYGAKALPIEIEVSGKSHNPIGIEASGYIR